MPYDKSLDAQVFLDAWENNDERVTVGVFSYNNGPKKLQLGREVKDAAGNTRFAKLGRLTKDEVTALLPLIQKALEHM